MIFLITGASHTGKTLLAQRFLSLYHIPYLSLDHLKMGLIRSGNTPLTPEDDGELTAYLWHIAAEIIKTAIENHQHLTVEGCYVPPHWRDSFPAEYLSEIRFVCLAMTERYIRTHSEEIRRRACDIESRMEDDPDVDWLIRDNARYLRDFGGDCFVSDNAYRADPTEIRRHMERRYP